MVHRPCCHSFLVSILKPLVFFQTFFGISIILYSAYALNHWNSSLPPPVFPPPSLPPPVFLPPSLPPPVVPPPSLPPDSSVPLLFTSSGSFEFPDRVDTPLNFVARDVVYSVTNEIASGFDYENRIPAPWYFDYWLFIQEIPSVESVQLGFGIGIFVQKFLSLGGTVEFSFVFRFILFIYTLMGVGTVLCCVTCIGHIAAEAYYGILTAIIIFFEAVFGAFVLFDQNWEKNLPFDPTGELIKLKSFIENNWDLCKWFGIAIVAVQASSLITALVLRAMVSTPKPDYDGDEEHGYIGNRSRELLLPMRSNCSSGSTKWDNDVARSEFWSSRMREKYGLDGGIGEVRNSLLFQATLANNTRSRR
ncbi:hypothetical protein RJ641_031193 [Dillenia turbinata]|uniref:Uncharacterized protein n=1 Tax=Dillenia turbinata TaxID=194707 RepID=A0AAN8VP85_9MAGN